MFLVFLPPSGFSHSWWFNRLPFRDLSLRNWSNLQSNQRQFPYFYPTFRLRHSTVILLRELLGTVKCMYVSEWTERRHSIPLDTRKLSGLCIDTCFAPSFAFARAQPYECVLGAPFGDHLLGLGDQTRRATSILTQRLDALGRWANAYAPHQLVCDCLKAPRYRDSPEVPLSQEQSLTTITYGVYTLVFRFKDTFFSLWRFCRLSWRCSCSRAESREFGPENSLFWTFGDK